jgi:hypothetical protein
MMHERRISDMNKSTVRVALQGSTVRIGNLDVHLDAAAEYLRGIPAEKLEAAFVHAVQVGMTEIMARRRRFQAAPHSPVTVTRTPVVAKPAAVAPPPVATPAIAAPVVATPVVVTPVVATPVVVTPVTTEPRAQVVTRVEENGVQPKAIAPPEPKMEAAEELSIEACSTAAPERSEKDGWLRRLDDDFESIDRALDASSGR